jgi:hypothetical protein
VVRKSQPTSELAIAKAAAANSLRTHTKNISFQLKTPNESTKRAIEETEQGIGIICYYSNNFFSYKRITIMFF